MYGPTNKEIKDMTTYNRREKLWTKDYITIMIAACGISFTTHFFLTTLPIYAEQISNTTAYIGFITGAYTLAALALRPVSGVLIDRIGRVKFLILGALLVSISCFLYNLATSILLLILLRILNGAGFGIHGTAAGAVAADVIPKSRLMEGMGYFGIYGTIGFALAPGIALSIIGDGHIENFKFLFIFAGIVSLVSMFLDTTISYEKKQKKTQGNANALKKGMTDNNISQNFQDTQELPKTFLGFESSVILPSIVVLFIYLGQSSIISFIALYAHEFNLGNIGFFFTLLAIGMFISRLSVGKIGDKYGPNIVIIPAMIILGFCQASIPFIRSFVFLMTIAFPLGIALGTVSPILNAIIIQKCSPSRKGTASAAYFSAIDIGIGIGSIFFGMIIAAYGYTQMFLGALVFTLIALIIYGFGLARKHRKKSFYT